MNGQDNATPSQGQAEGVPVVRLVYRPLATWPRVTWLAVMAMLFSILFSVIPAVVALILGIAAVVRIRRSQGRYDGYFPAIYAIVVSGLVILSSLGQAIWVITRYNGWSPGP